MMRGRPRASYALPRLWSRLAEIDYLANHRGLIKLKNDNFKPDHRFPHGTMLSVREIENTFNVFSPRLISDRFAADVVAMLNAVRQKRDLAPLNLNDEIVQCAARIRGLKAASPAHNHEHGDPIADLAIAAGLSEDTICFALEGVILPRQICDTIVRAAASIGVTSLVAEDWDPRWGGNLPETFTLAEIFRRLSR